MMEVKIPIKDMKKTFENKSIVSFLDDAYAISNSEGTRDQYKFTLYSVNRFCIKHYGTDMVQHVLSLHGKPIEEILEFFKEYKRYLDTKITRFGNPTFNNSKRIQISILKKYSISCGFKIHQEDIEDCITIGRKMRIKKYPLINKIVSKIINEMPHFEFKALTILLAGTGMRKTEAITLLPSDFDFTSHPVSIHLRASITKTREDRIIYLTKECAEMMEQLINKKPETHHYLFGKSSNHRQISETYGKSLRRVLKKIELYKKLDNGFGQITVHSFRQFFRTFAGHLISRDFAESFIGHRFYLSEYENMPEEERKKIFLKLEPHMTFLEPKIKKPSENPEVIELERQLTEIQNKVKIIGNRLLV